ncbi:terminase small subunit [Deinococcus multiflagellatus]|uniref:Terminase small subunit n=1 Tax=Deinococcus multiflagellatus TaxID=1656887 RepID=A0ABW1ZPV9_9DEIO
MLPQERRFVMAKLDFKNNTEAAKDAGYSERTAKEQGSRLLTRVHVSEAIRAGWIARGYTRESLQAAIHEMLEFDPGEVTSYVNEKVTDWEEVLASTVLADVRAELEAAEDMLRALPPVPKKKRGQPDEPDPYEVERATLEREVAQLRRRETTLAIQVRKNPDVTVLEPRTRLKPTPYIDLDKVQRAGKHKFISAVKTTAHGRNVELISLLDVVKLAGSSLGLFSEHHIHTGPDGGPIQNQTTFNADKATGEQIAQEYAKLLEQVK